MCEVYSNPIAYWGMVLGLFCATVIVVSSMLFLLRAAVEAVRLARYKQTFLKLAQVLTAVAVKNEQTNPAVALVAKVMVRQILPGSDVFKADEVAINRMLQGEVSDGSGV